uniref:Uncharacterized protein n=1 Tax=Arundo donax TaxID=35708 RepID=A0A0A9DD88_ARUDO
MIPNKLSICIICCTRYASLFPCFDVVRTW